MKVLLHLFLMLFQIQSSLQLEGFARVFPVRHSCRRSSLAKIYEVFLRMAVRANLLPHMYIFTEHQYLSGMESERTENSLFSSRHQLRIHFTSEMRWGWKEKEKDRNSWEATRGTWLLLERWYISLYPLVIFIHLRVSQAQRSILWYKTSNKCTESRHFTHGNIHIWFSA